MNFCEYPQHEHNNRAENASCIITTAQLANGDTGIAIRHGHYMMFLPNATALDYANRIVDTLEQSGQDSA